MSRQFEAHVLIHRSLQAKARSGLYPNLYARRRRSWKARALQAVIALAGVLLVWRAW